MTTVRKFVVAVCEDCLSMLGTECHTPGCSFWMHDTPSPDVVSVLSETGYLSERAEPQNGPIGPESRA